jgi:hypothetical protein
MVGKVSSTRIQTKKGSENVQGVGLGIRGDDEERLPDA